jgi:hypothetical protein
MLKFEISSLVYGLKMEKILRKFSSNSFFAWWYLKKNDI